MIDPDWTRSEAKNGSPITPSVGLVTCSQGLSLYKTSVIVLI